MRIKKNISLLLLIFLSENLLFAGVQGALPGAFSVSATKKVYFSQGNLQYQASTSTWRFAANQYTRIGANGNNNISATYTGWIDWFAWGTGNNPTNTNSNNTSYSTFTDWGKNAISNGGNQANLWRTLTQSEWEYLFSGRTNAANRRSMATVNNIKGYILLPDSWSLPSGLTFKTDVNSDWEKNKYSIDQWQQMEQNGAVFLPMTAAIWSEAYSSNLTYYDTGWFSDNHCNYWSSTQASSAKAYMFHAYINGYYSKHEVSISDCEKRYRQGVRLVIDSDKNTTYTITWKNYDGTTLTTSIVNAGVTPTYTGSTPTKPSDTQYEYVFSGWTPSITVATANKTYTATYTTLSKYTITFYANGGLIPTNGNMGNTPSGHTTTLSSDQTSGTVVVTTNKMYFQTMTNDCPSREGYTFEGWYTDPTSGEQVYDNTGSRVVGVYWNSEGKWIGTSDVTLYAHWSPILYTITWKDEDGTMLDQSLVEYGQTPTHSDPIKAPTAEYTYTFAGWTPSVSAVTGDQTYTATYTATKQEYTITWKQDDGTAIDQTLMEYGQTPTHADPTKTGGEGFYYSFAGWTPAVSNVTGNATYTATYTKITSTKDVTIKAKNGKLRIIAAFPAESNVTLQADANASTTFHDWSDGNTDIPRTVVTVEGDSTTASFDKLEYTITAQQ